MATYRFTLQSYKNKSTRHGCPACGKRNVFSRYIDSETGEYLSSEVGRCNREIKCGYHYTPKRYFEYNPMSANSIKTSGLPSQPKQAPRLASFVPVELFKKSLIAYEENNFTLFLEQLLGSNKATQLIERYYIGTSRHWEGATVFWQVDEAGRIRTGKIMVYNSTTGKRVKEPYKYITWVHRLLKIPDYNLQQCLFGEHLLAKQLDKPVAIVESEKTAVIASAYFEEFVWVATGGLSNLKPERCEALKGRKVVLFPDLNAYGKWLERARGIAENVEVSDFLELRATSQEREEGLDIADYLIRYTTAQEVQQEQVQEPAKECVSICRNQREYYKHTYGELVEMLGEEGALQKVKLYQQLSEQYKSCSTFVVHTCPLLTSFYANRQNSA